MSNFDIDIFLNFSPDKCLFLDYFMNQETNAEKKSDEPIQIPNNEDAMLGKVLVPEGAKQQIDEQEQN